MNAEELLMSLQAPNSQPKQEMEEVEDMGEDLNPDEIREQIRGNSNSERQLEYLKEELANLEQGLWNGEKRYDGQKFLWGGPVNENWNETNNDAEEEKWKRKYELIKAMAPLKVEGRKFTKEEIKKLGEVKYALNLLHNQRCRSQYLRNQGYRRNPYPLFEYKNGGPTKTQAKCMPCDPKQFQFHTKNKKAGPNKDGCIPNTLGKKRKLLEKVPKKFFDKVSPGKVRNPKTGRVMSIKEAKKQTFIDNKGIEKPVSKATRKDAIDFWLNKRMNPTRKKKPTATHPIMPNQELHRVNLDQLYKLIEERKASRLSDGFLNALGKLRGNQALAAGFKRKTRRRRKKKKETRRRRKKKGTRRRKKKGTLNNLSGFI